MKLNRRQFISNSVRHLLAIGIAPEVISVIFQSAFNKAYGNILDTDPIKYGIRYAHLSFPNAPPRWLFDLPLRPNGPNDDFEGSDGFGTSIIKSGGEFSVEYKTVKHPNKDLYLPLVWSMNLTDQKFDSILNNMVFIRGMDMEIDNHSVSNGRQTAPIIGGYSLHGSIADQLQNPIPGVLGNQSASGVNFKSRKGLSPLLASYGNPTATNNPFTRLLAPFNNIASSANRDSKITNAVEQVQNQFDQYAKSKGLSKSGLKVAHVKADQLIRDQVMRLASDPHLGWQVLSQKYQGIFNEATHPAKGTLPGIYNLEISCPTLPSDLSKVTAYNRKFRRDNPNSYFQLGDLRDAVNVNNLNSNGFVANFAMLEFLFLSGLSGTVNLAFSPFESVKLTPTSNTSFTHDQHFMGVIPSTLITTLYFRAFLGCLTEVVKQFKNAKIFDKTLIHIGSDFNRSPQKTGAGSDHGVSGSGTSLISGMIKETHVLGNIKIRNSDSSSRYQGTWGDAADWDFGPEQRPIRVTDVSRTITSMCGAQDIVNNGYSLLMPDGSGGWKPVSSQGGKNVE